MDKELPSLSAILKNPHFVQLACFIGVPYREPYWGQRHPEIPAKLLINGMTRIAFKGSSPLTRDEQERFLGLFADFASQVVMADMRLSYGIDDMDWLLETLSGPYGKVTLSMLFAVASCKEHYFSPGEVAELLEENEVVWRRKAQRHEVPGTIHKSRGYLIPLSGLQSIGLLTDYRPKDDREEYDDEDGATGETLLAQYTVIDQEES